MSKGMSIAGRVMDAEGVGIHGETVVLSVHGDEWGAVKTNPDGGYRFSWVHGGVYTVDVGPGMASAEVEVKVGDKPTTASFRLA